jgi:Diaminopimelate decarboxylase
VHADRPSCDSQDTILDQVWLPEPQAGDQVLIGNAGAYTTCYSGRSAFNGFPAPGVRIVREGVHPGPFGIMKRSWPDGHHGWLLLVKWVSVSMSSAL